MAGTSAKPRVKSASKEALSAARSSAKVALDEGATVQRDEIVNMIGPKIAALRKAQGLSLQQLANSSDVSAAAIHKIERSGMVPTVTTLAGARAAVEAITALQQQTIEVNALQDIHPGLTR